MTKYTTTIGIDLGDKHSVICVLDKDGEVLGEGRLRMTRNAIVARFGSMERTAIAMESATHSRLGQ